MHWPRVTMVRGMVVAGAAAALLVGFVFIERAGSGNDARRVTTEGTAAGMRASDGSAPAASEASRLDTLGARLPALRAQHLDNAVDADIDQDEAAALRARAAEIKRTIARLEGQRVRGARAWVEDPAVVKTRIQRLDQERLALEQRATELDREAAELDDRASRDKATTAELELHHLLDHGDPDATATLDEDTDVDDEEDTSVD